MCTRPKPKRPKGVPEPTTSRACSCLLFPNPILSSASCSGGRPAARIASCGGGVRLLRATAAAGCCELHGVEWPAARSRGVRAAAAAGLLRAAAAAGGCCTAAIYRSTARKTPCLNPSPSPRCFLVHEEEAKRKRPRKKKLKSLESLMRDVSAKNAIILLCEVSIS